MKKKINYVVLILIVIAGFIVKFSVPVTAEGNDILEGKTWNHAFFNGANGTFTSTDSSGFTANMSSIGSGEWDARFNISEIALTANTSYIFETNILSDKDRYSNFVSLCTNNNTCNGGLFTDYLVDFPKDKKVTVKRVFTPTTNYNNATLYFGFGKNGYEGDRVLANSANKITVSNTKITTLADYSWMLDNPDYTSYNYIKINPPVADYAHQDYEYAVVENINFAQAENRPEFGETIAVATTAGEVKAIGGKYQVYVNGKLVTPPEATAGWYHINYDDLDREYNEVWTLSVNNTFSTIIIKNGRVTTTKAQLLNDLNTNYRIPNQDSSNAVKQIIEDAATGITNAATIEEAQAIYDGLGDKINLQKHKETRSKDVSDAGANTNDEIEAIVTQAISDIAEATSIAAVDSIADNAIEVIEGKKTEIANAKTAAIAEINELIGDNPNDAVTALANSAKEAINAATTVDGVTAALNTGKTLIQAQQLSDAKVSAIEELNNFVAEGDSDAVSDMAEAGVAAINAATSIDDVNSILNEVKNNIILQRTKEDRIADVNAAGANTNDEIEAIVAQAISDITAATTIDSVNSIADSAIEVIESKKTEVSDTKTAAIAEIDSLVDIYTSDSIEILAEAAKNAINEANTVELVNSTLNSWKSIIETQQLAEVKSNAIAAVEEAAGEEASRSSAVKKIVTDAKTAINSASSIDEVNSILEQAKNDISERQTLEEAQKVAINKINKSIPKDASDAVKAIAKKAIEAINKASTKEEIESILNKTLKDIENQIVKDEQETNNPLTLDNIMKYFLALFIGTFGMVIITNKKVLKRSR